MNHNIELSDEEQIALYLTLPPEDVARMLLHSNKHLRYFLNPVRLKVVPLVSEKEWVRIEAKVFLMDSNSSEDAFSLIKTEVNQILNPMPSESDAPQTCSE